MILIIHENKTPKPPKRMNMKMSEPSILKYIHTYIPTYIRTYIQAGRQADRCRQTYIHTYIHTFQILSKLHDFQGHIVLVSE